MRAAITVLAVICMMVGLSAASQRQSGVSNSSPCAIVQQALTDAQHIKIGMTRREVERYFVEDGGLQFPQRTRYGSLKCAYLMLEIDFDLAPSRGRASSTPNDTVTKISKMFVEYPAKD